MSSLLLLPLRSMGQVMFADDFEVTCPATPCTGILAGNCLPMWFTSHGTPEVRPDLSTGNRSLCLAYNGFSNGEGAFRTLPIGEQFLPCQLYTLSFRIRTLDMTMPGNARYQIALTNTLQNNQPPINPSACSGPIPQVSPMQVIFSRPATDFLVNAEWAWITCHFVPDQPFSQLWVSATATNVQFDFNNMFCIDDLNVTLTGPVPPADATASINPDPVCQGESAEIRYRICNAVGLSATTYTVQASLPAGLSLMPGSVNPVAATIQGGACVANSNCVDAVFQIAVAPNQPPGTYTIPLSVGVQSAHGCINGWADEVSVEVKDCVFACPCDTPGEVNTNINGFDYNGQTGEVLLSQLIDDGTLPPNIVSGRCIAIHGTLRIDVSPEDGYTFEDCEMRMQPGAAIVVRSYSTLDLNSLSHNGGIYGCDQMWRGIRVEPEARLNVRETWIADAQYAVEVMDKSNILLRSNVFRRNYTSLFFSPPPPLNAGEFNLEQCNMNLFSGVEPLLPPFANQSPLPGVRPFAGVDVTGQSLLRIGVASAVQPNTFFALRNGIITTNTHTIIENTIFENIVHTTTEPNYPYTGFAVRHSGSAAHGLDLRGLGMNPAAPATFHNCTNGVWATGTDVSVRETRMTGMGVGVTVEQGAERRIEVFNNNISASSRGIQIAESPQAALISIRDNEVTAGLAPPMQSKARAIQADGSSAVQGAEIRNNTISTLGSDFGIYMNACAGFEIDQNVVDVLNADNSQGIHVAGGNDNILSNNTVTGILQEENGVTLLLGAGNGVWLSGAGNIRLWCNTLSTLNMGLQLSGQHTGADIATTLFRTPMGTGLRYANGALAPQQNGRGNRWEGTGQDYSDAAARHDGANEADIQATAYRISGGYDPTQSFNIYPPSVQLTNFPGLPATTWFPTNGMAAVACATQPQLQDNEEENAKLRRLIAVDSLGSIPDGTKWDAVWALYRKLLEEPQLMAEDSLLTAFFHRIALLPSGKLAMIEQGKAELFAPNDLTGIISGWVADLKSISLEIRLIDSLVVADSLEWLPAQWYALMEEAKQISDAIQVLSAQADSLRREDAALLLLENAGISASQLPEANWQAVNEIYLGSIVAGKFSFSEGQKDTIIAIASQCPELGGGAVFSARALQALFDPETVYDEFIPCASNAMIGEAGPAPTDLSGELMHKEALESVSWVSGIFPNPAGEYFLVAYDTEYPVRMYIYDMYGKVRRSLVLPSGRANSETINTSDLESGVYVVSLSNAGGEVANIRLLVVK